MAKKKGRAAEAAGKDKASEGETAASSSEITAAEDAAAAAEVAATAFRLRQENEELRLQVSAQNEILGKKTEAYALLAAEMAAVRQEATLMSIENPEAATTLSRLLSPQKGKASATATALATPTPAVAPRAPPNSVAKEVRPGDATKVIETMPSLLDSPVSTVSTLLGESELLAATEPPVGDGGANGNGGSPPQPATPTAPLLRSRGGNPFDYTPSPNPEAGDASPCPAFEAVDDYPTDSSPPRQSSNAAAAAAAALATPNLDALATVSPKRNHFGALEYDNTADIASNALALPSDGTRDDDANELRHKKAALVQSAAEVSQLLKSLRREMVSEQQSLEHIRSVLGRLWEQLMAVNKEMSAANGADASEAAAVVDPTVGVKQTLQLTLDEKHRIYESMNQKEETLKQKLEALYNLLAAKNESLVAATGDGKSALSDEFSNFEGELIDLTLKIETTQDELSRLAIRRDDVRNERLMIQRRMNDGDIISGGPQSRTADPTEALQRSMDVGLLQIISRDFPSPTDSAIVMAEQIAADADLELQNRREITFADFMKLDGKVNRFGDEEPAAYKRRLAHVVWWGRVYEERQHAIVNELSEQLVRGVEKQREMQQRALKVDFALSRKESELRFLQVSSLTSLLLQKETVIEEQRVVLNAILKKSESEHAAPPAPLSPSEREAAAAEAAAASSAKKAAEVAEALNYGADLGLFSEGDAPTATPLDQATTGALTPMVGMSPARSNGHLSLPTSPANAGKFKTNVEEPVVQQHASPKKVTSSTRQGTATILARLREVVRKLQDARQNYRTGSRSGVDEDAEGNSLAFVQVTVVKARELPPVMKTRNTCNAFVTVAVTPAGSSIVTSTSRSLDLSEGKAMSRTETVRQTLYPAWNEDFVIKGVPHSSAVVRFTVLHNSGMRTNSQLRHDHDTADDMIGFAEVDLSTVMDQKKHYFDLVIEPPVEPVSPPREVVLARGLARRSSSLGPLAGSRRKRKPNVTKQSTLRVAIRFIHDRVARLEDMKYKLQADLREEQDRMEDLQVAREALGAARGSTLPPPPYVPPDAIPVSPYRVHKNTTPVKAPQGPPIDGDTPPRAQTARRSVRAKRQAPAANKPTDAAGSNEQRKLTTRSARRMQALRDQRAKQEKRGGGGGGGGGGASAANSSAMRSRGGASSLRLPTPPTEDPRVRLEASANFQNEDPEGGEDGEEEQGREEIGGDSSGEGNAVLESPTSRPSPRFNGLLRSKHLTGSPARVAMSPPKASDITRAVPSSVTPMPRTRIGPPPTDESFDRGPWVSSRLVATAPAGSFASQNASQRMAADRSASTTMREPLASSSIFKRPHPKGSSHLHPNLRARSRSAEPEGPRHHPISKRHDKHLVDTSAQNEEFKERNALENRIYRPMRRPSTGS